MTRQYQLIAINKKTGKEFLIGTPDTHDRICNFKKAHSGCIGEDYNDYIIKEVEKV